MKAHYFFALLFAAPAFSLAQRVGIGTTTPNPTAVLHVNAGNSTTGLLVTGTYSPNFTSLPDLGFGSRLMFYPGKAAFRAGYVSGSTWNNSKIGIHSAALGVDTEASGDAATAMGYKTTASGPAATALGWETVAKAIGGVAIGVNNDATDAPSQNDQNPNDRIFQIGNGNLLDDTRSNAVTVLRNGNVGIGSDVLAPAYPLDINGRMRIRSGGAAASSAGIWLNRNDNSGLLGFVGVDGSNSIGIYSIASSWHFLVNPATGNAWLKGSLAQNSDARLKKNIEPIHNALAQLSQLNGYHYNWKEENRDSSLQTGLLAQEVEKLMPELVKADAQGTLAVNYSGLIPYLLEATKEQQSTILEQQSTIVQLQTQLHKLTQLVEQLVKK